MFNNIVLAFIPIFVAVDAIGVLPIFISLTQDLDLKQRNKVIIQSVFVGIGLAVGFVFIGKAVFSILGITVGDFMIAGGSVLFCIAIIDLLRIPKESRIPVDEVGAVPIGTPLMVGPAVLTTSLIITDQYGIIPTLISIFGNVLLAGLIFSLSNVIIRILGSAGSRVLSKIMALLLVAIAVMMIRKGFFYILNHNCPN